jgi:hypothetical protein
VEKYFVTGLRTEICTGAEVCARLGVCVGVFVLGCSYWDVQVGVVRSSWCVQVGAFCEFLVSIL